MICRSTCAYFFFFFKQRTAYEVRISDWSSDVCSSDLKQWRFSIDRQLEMTAETGGIQFESHFGKRDVDTIDNVSDQRLDEPISTVTQQSCQLLCFFDERWNVVFIRR